MGRLVSLDTDCIGCTFYIFSRESYELLGSRQLGEDLSSDICGGHLFCGTVDGRLLQLDKASLARSLK